MTNRSAGQTAAAGGSLSGTLYQVFVPALAIVTAGIQAAAMLVLTVTLRQMGPRADA